MKLTTSTSPLVLAATLDAQTSHAWRAWEPEDFVHELKLDKSDVHFLDKLLATQVCATNPDVFDDWTLFHHVATVFNGRRANFGYLDELHTEELAFTCYCLTKLNPGHGFGLAVQRYIAAICLVDGLLYFPWSDPPIDVTTFSPLQGIVDKELTKTVSELKPHVEKLASLEHSDVDNHDVFQVQLQKLVAVASYIKELL